MSCARNIDGILRRLKRGPVICFNKFWKIWHFTINFSDQPSFLTFFSSFKWLKLVTLTTRNSSAGCKSWFWVWNGSSKWTKRSGFFKEGSECLLGRTTVSSHWSRTESLAWQDVFQMREDYLLPASPFNGPVRKLWLAWDCVRGVKTRQPPHKCSRDWNFHKKKLSCHCFCD